MLTYYPPIKYLTKGGLLAVSLINLMKRKANKSMAFERKCCKCETVTRKFTCPKCKHRLCKDCVNYTPKSEIKVDRGPAPNLE